MYTQTILSPDTLQYMDHNMDKLQMGSRCSGLSHKRVEEAAPNAQQNTWPQSPGEQ